MLVEDDKLNSSFKDAIVLWTFMKIDPGCPPR